MASSFRITVPARITGKGFQPFFKGWTWINPLADHVIMDFQKCEYIAPWAITMFAAYGLWLFEAQGKSVTIEVNPDSEVGRYLVDTGFCKLFGDDVLPVEREGFTV